MPDIVKVYDASNSAEAELLRGELEGEGLTAYVDNTPSPLDGLTSMGQGTPIFVETDHADEARKIIDRYLHEQQ